MFIQCGYAPLHLLILHSALSTDLRLIHLERLLAAGAAINQTVADGKLVCVCMTHKAFHVLYVLLCMIQFIRIKEYNGIYYIMSMA